MEPILPFAVELGRDGQGLVASLTSQLAQAIIDRRLVAGQALPSSRELARSLGISRNTATAAYDLLLAKGLVCARSHASPVVAELPAKPSPCSPAHRKEDPRALLQSRLRRYRGTYPADLPPANFRTGVPEQALFPHLLWRKLTAQALRRQARLPFSYGPPEGLQGLRDAICHHVAFARAVSGRPEDVIVTSGAQQAFDLIARVFVDPGKTRVAVEHPGYPPMHAAFEAAGAELVFVDVDPDGMLVEQIPADVSIICVTPSHQAPMGMALSMERRLSLIEFAASRGAIVVEDDYDGEFQYGSQPMDAMQTLDHSGVVFYVGTFSKCMFPSLRIGFVIAPGWAAEALAHAKWRADSHGEILSQSILADFIRDGHLARHVRRMRTLYAERRRALHNGITRHLGEWLEPLPGNAGIHFAAKLKPAAMNSGFEHAMRTHAPGAQLVAEYSLSGSAPTAVLLGYGSIDASGISATLATWGSHLRAQAFAGAAMVP